MATPTWDLTDQDCNAFDGNWTNNDSGDGTTTANITKDSRITYRIEGNTGQPFFGNPSLSAWTSGTFEIVFKADGVQSNTTGFALFLRDNSIRQWQIFYIWAADQVGSTPLRMIILQAGVSSPNLFYQWFDETRSGESGWITLRAVIATDGGLHVWINGQYLGTAAYSSGTTSGANTMGIQIFSGGAQHDIWFDSLKGSTDDQEPDAISIPFRYPSSTLNTRPANPTSVMEGATWSATSPNNQDKVRYNHKNSLSGLTNLSFALPLVASGAGDLSKVSIYDGSTVKRLQSLPQF